MEEAAEEAEHKACCDTELSSNEQTRKEKTAAVESLTAQKDELEASIAELTEVIAELTQAIAVLDAAMAKYTNLRNEEKAKNKATTNCSCAGSDCLERLLREKSWQTTKHPVTNHGLPDGVVIGVVITVLLFAVTASVFAVTATVTRTEAKRRRRHSLQTCQDRTIHLRACQWYIRI